MVRHEAAEALGSIADDPEVRFPRPRLVSQKKTIAILKKIGEEGSGAVQE